MLGRYIVDQLEHVHSLADPGAAKQPDLAAFGKRTDQVDHLDPRLEQLYRRGQFVEFGRRLVNRAKLVGLDRAAVIDRPAKDIHDASQCPLAHRHRDWRAGTLDLHAAAQAVGGAERDAADHAIAELLLDLEGEVLLHQRVGSILLQKKRVIDARHVFARKLDVDHRADALDDGALCLCHSFFLVLYGGCAADDF